MLFRSQGRQRQLEGMGLQVSLMLNPAAAIDAISRSRTVNFPFDFIFADADMAAPAGVAFAEAWKAAGGPESLLMLLTTESQRAELARLRELGVSAHLVKPVGADDARDALMLAGNASRKSGDVVLDEFNLEAAPVVDADDILDILLIEDNPVNQELALRLLRKKNHRVTVANNGAEALDQFDSSKTFDVILMDMQMPVMGGLECRGSGFEKPMFSDMGFMLFGGSIHHWPNQWESCGQGAERGSLDLGGGVVILSPCCHPRVPLKPRQDDQRGIRWTPRKAKNL